MDFYLNSENSFKRLFEEYSQYGSLTIAYDFDDTVFDFHKKGRIYNEVIHLLKELKSINCFLICWTGQDDLGFVKKYLVENNIPFDTINKNPPFHKSESIKIYSNAYLDDRAGLKQVFDELKKLVEKVTKLKNSVELEILSDKIHQFWMCWAKGLLESEPNLTNERKVRWEKECFVEYKNLSPEMKDLDRAFAREIMKITH